MLSGERPTIYGDGPQSRDFTCVENVVCGKLAAASTAGAVGSVINVACGDQIMLPQSIASINNDLGTDIEPNISERRRGDVRFSLADLSTARELLMYEPVVTFEEGLRHSISYYSALQRTHRPCSRSRYRNGFC